MHIYTYKILIYKLNMCARMLFALVITIINTKVNARAQLVATTLTHVHTLASACLLHSYICVVCNVWQ